MTKFICQHALAYEVDRKLFTYWRNVCVRARLKRLRNQLLKDRAIRFVAAEHVRQDGNAMGGWAGYWLDRENHPSTFIFP